MPVSLPFLPSPRQTTLASKHHLHLPGMPMKRDWSEVTDDEAGVVSEARATAAITARTGNPSVLAEIAENATRIGTGTRTLDQEKVETAMIDAVTILEIVTISAVGTAESGMTGVGGLAETAHAPALVTGGEPAIAHAVVVERGESVPVVAIGYVLQVLLLETLSSKNGS